MRRNARMVKKGITKIIKFIKVDLLIKGFLN